MRSKKAFGKYIIMFSLLVFISLCALRFGSVSLSAKDFYSALFMQVGHETESIIIYLVRLPRLLAALLAGVGLSVSGVLLQNLTDNALASPNTIGVNAGAGLGAVLSMSAFFISAPLVSASLNSFFAFLGAFLTTLFVLFLSHRVGGSKSSVILSGVAVTAVLNAIISVITLIDSDILISYNSFSIGSFSGVKYSQLVLPSIVIFLCFILSSLLSRQIDILCIGDGMATLTGVNIKRLRICCILCASASAASVVSFAGLLGFVGLVVPHIARKIVGNSTKASVFASATVGAIITASADLLGRIILAPSEIPVGIMMSLLGVPFFIFIMFKKKGEY